MRVFKGVNVVNKLISVSFASMQLTVDP